MYTHTLRRPPHPIHTLWWPPFRPCIHPNTSQHISPVVYALIPELSPSHLYSGDGRRRVAIKKIAKDFGDSMEYANSFARELRNLYKNVRTTQLFPYIIQ